MHLKKFYKKFEDPAKPLVILQEIQQSAENLKKLLTNLKRCVIMTSMKWNDYRKKAVKYVTNGAIADLVGPGISPKEDYNPTWTVADEDHDGLYSLKKWFLEYRSDPTETKFVDECFEGDFRHWEAFKNSQSIKPIYERIKKEATQRNLADIMQKITDTAMDDNNKSQMVALKYLVEKYSKDAGEPSASRGRPKKADIDKAAKEIAEEDKATAEDLKRIMG